MSLAAVLSRWTALAGLELPAQPGAVLGDGARGISLGAHFIKVYPAEMSETRLRHAELLSALQTAKTHPLMPIPSTSGALCESDGEHCVEVYVLLTVKRPFYEDYLAADGIADILSGLQRADVDTFRPFFIQRDHTFFEEALSVLRKLAPPDRADIVHVLERTVYTGLAPYLPFAEKRLTHGDLHPANIFTTPSRDALAGDWEFARIDTELFDLAFLVGCVGIDDPELLTGHWIRRLFGSFARQGGLSRLGRELFYDLLIATRIPWLVTWLSRRDAEMVDTECTYIRLLIARRQWFTTQWMEWLPLRAVDGEKWVVADAVIDDAAKKVKSIIDEENLKTTAALLKDRRPADLAAALRQLVIAYGKEGNVSRVLDMVQMQEELFERTSMDDELLPELAYTYANASLDCARHGQLAALRELDDRVAKLRMAVPTCFDTLCAQAFVLRNLSILLDDLGRHDEAEHIVGYLSALYLSSEKAMPLAGELARALSSRVIAALKDKNLPAAEALTTTIETFVNDWPDYYKTTTALAFARKNIEAFRQKHIHTPSKEAPHAE